MMTTHPVRPGTPLGLRSRQGVPVPLQHVRVSGRIRDLQADIEIEQRFRNAEQGPIEAVFTFPLAPAAVLLGFEVEVAGRTLEGRVVRRREAEAAYEQAIADGDTALRLHSAGGGAWTVEVGNLGAGESCVVRIRCSELLRWRGEEVRWALPTVIGGRYGQPAPASVSTVSHDRAVDHRFDLDLHLEGLWRDGAFDCPTHWLTSERTGEGTRLRLRDGNAPMDRDLVLNLRSAQAAASVVHCAPDGDAQIVHLALRPRLEDVRDLGPRAFKFVVDCSGSMAGDSIEQARRALHAIVEQLRDEDVFNVYAFGSSVRPIFDRMHPARAVRAEASYRLARLEADLGGTEMAGALDFALRDPAPAGWPVSLLLITDGQIHGGEAVVRAMRASGHRCFTVGVGSAPNAPFLTSLAEDTGGAAEFVTPGEGMSGRIVRHFERMRTARLCSVTVDWGAPVVRQVPGTMTSAFDGDTLHVFAWTRSRPGVVRVTATHEDGRPWAASIPADRHARGPELPRLAASVWLEQAGVDAECVALDYQLLSPFTDYLVVHRRADADKVVESPQLRVVDHMHAAGQDGFGSVMASFRVRDEKPLFGFDVPPVAKRLHSVALPGVSTLASDRAVAEGPDLAAVLPYFERPSRRMVSCRTEGPPPTPLERTALDRRDWVWRVLNATHWLARQGRISVGTIAQLRSHGIPAAHGDALERLVARGWPEYVIVVAYLRALASSRTLTDTYLQASARTLARAWDALAPGEPRSVEIAAAAEALFGVEATAG